MSPLAHVFALPVKAYRLLFSPWVGHNCRYHPTCSQYALEALATHGGLRGGWLAFRRVLRCHPWGASGHDPVPGQGAAQDQARESGSSKPGSSDR
ncbi:membrane protein insertion efficiency factor YidD [Roseovarius phycicola]|uniref:Putative membrane protein insertion efficiency factor n=1 Tax=Roseovarius phycicola TaxID=3080976 RepID=A0ABZ2HPZ1_9RHOB